MIIVNQDDFERLEKAKLIKHGRSERNFRVTSQKKKSSRKKYYVSETRQILLFLGLAK